jgi:hypothetical protein
MHLHVLACVNAKKQRLINATKKDVLHPRADNRVVILLYLDHPKDPVINAWP